MVSPRGTDANYILFIELCRSSVSSAAAQTRKKGRTDRRRRRSSLFLFRSFSLALSLAIRLFLRPVLPGSRRNEILLALMARW